MGNGICKKKDTIIFLLFSLSNYFISRSINSYKFIKFNLTVKYIFNDYNRNAMYWFPGC